MFSKAIVKPPGPNFISALTSADLGPPDVELARKQHAAYVAALASCGLEVIALPPDDHPDSTFVEDTAICTPECAVLTRPGALSRRSEVNSIKPLLAERFDQLFEIESPGTLDGGDVLEVDDTFYIGISERTNESGAMQLLEFLGTFDYSGLTIDFPQLLHLKSGVSYLHNDVLLICPQFNHLVEFRTFRRIVISDPRDAYGANAVWINGTILVASGYPSITELIREEGFNVIELDMSEFEKTDGGLSCLSLRF